MILVSSPIIHDYASDYFMITIPTVILIVPMIVIMGITVSRIITIVTMIIIPIITIMITVRSMCDRIIHCALRS